jgi:hypothetical protein
MANLVEVLGTKDLIAATGHDPSAGFESLYSTLCADDPKSRVVQQIEQRVEDYFTELALPAYPTIYDFLLLSLREKDAIFTFNWDPFLVDAHARHVDSVPMPHIFHLHGNVRVAFCENCRLAMRKATLCHKCGGKLMPTRLLYPVEQKNYTDDPFIASQWDKARDFIKRAGIITIFGYSAPTTDKEAMTIFTKAWKGEDRNKLPQRLEIIDVRDHNEIGQQWSSFAFSGHYDIHRSFYESLLARYPRRSCEALGHMSFDGKFVEPITWAGNLSGLSDSIADLADHEE